MMTQPTGDKDRVTEMYGFSFPVEDADWLHGDYREYQENEGDLSFTDWLFRAYPEKITGYTYKKYINGQLVEEEKTTYK